MKTFKYIVSCVVILSMAGGIITVNVAGASTLTPPHPIFCTAELNGALSIPNAPDSLSLVEPVTVSDANMLVPVYKNYLRNLKTGASDIEAAAKAAPSAKVASAYSKAGASYEIDISYFKVALLTLIKLANTKNAHLLLAISSAINKATSAAYAAEHASQVVESETILPCTPWGTAENTANIVAWHASTLARVARTHGDGLATLSDLRSASNKQISGPKVSVASALPPTGALKSAKLLVTSKKYSVLVCVKYTKVKPQIPTVTICKHQ